MIPVLRVVPVLDFGGVERILTTWADVLSTTSYSPRVLTFWKAGRTARRLREMGVVVHSLDVDPSVRNPAATLALTNYLRSVRTPIVHSSISEANFHTAIAARLLRRRGIVLEETGIPHRSQVGRFVFGKLYRSADAIVAVSEAVADYLVHHEAIPDELIRMVPNCVPGYFFSAPPREGAERGDSVFRVLAAGRLHSVKNFDGLIWAMRHVVQHNPSITLHIAGEGPEHAALHRLVTDLRLEANVQFLGYRDDVHDLLGDADLFVMPSHSEGLSVAVLEAAAKGVPILASNRGGNPEVLADAADRFELLLEPTASFDWARRILEIARMEPSKRAEIGNALRLSVSARFGTDLYRTSTLELYGQLWAKE